MFLWTIQLSRLNNLPCQIFPYKAVCWHWGGVLFSANLCAKTEVRKINIWDTASQTPIITSYVHTSSRLVFFKTTYSKFKNEDVSFFVTSCDVFCNSVLSSIGYFCLCGSCRWICHRNEGGTPDWHQGGRSVQVESDAWPRGLNTTGVKNGCQMRGDIVFKASYRKANSHLSNKSMLLLW